MAQMQNEPAFVESGNGSMDRGPSPSEPDKKNRGGNGEGPNVPLIGALIQKLPKNGSWPIADRVIWLKMITMAFNMAYGREANIEIKVVPGG
jgi:hypothetical protein